MKRTWLEPNARRSDTVIHAALGVATVAMIIHLALGALKFSAGAGRVGHAVDHARPVVVQFLPSQPGAVPSTNLAGRPAGGRPCGTNTGAGAGDSPLPAACVTAPGAQVPSGCPLHRMLAWRPFGD